MKAIYYIVINLTDILYIVDTNVSLTWFEHVPPLLLKMYTIKENKVLSYLFTCSLKGEMADFVLPGFLGFLSYSRDFWDFHGILGIFMGFLGFAWDFRDFHGIFGIFIVLQIHIYIIYYILVYLSEMFRISLQPYYVLWAQ